jgi:hypothetical protein
LKAVWIHIHFKWKQKDICEHNAAKIREHYITKSFVIYTSHILKCIIFWDVTPCSLCACHLLTCWFLLKLCSSALKMEAICSSETSVATRQTTRRHIPEDDTLHNHRCENLKFCKYILLSGYWSLMSCSEVHARGKVCTEFQRRNILENSNLVGQEGDGRIMLKWISLSGWEAGRIGLESCPMTDFVLVLLRFCE